MSGLAYILFGGSFNRTLHYCSSFFGIVWGKPENFFWGFLLFNYSLSFTYTLHPPIRFLASSGLAGFKLLLGLGLGCFGASLDPLLM